MKALIVLAQTALLAAILPLAVAAPASAAPDDGARDDVVPLADVAAVGDEAVTYRGRTFFPGYTRAHGTELWVSDGTPAGTREVVDLVPEAKESSPESLAIFKGRLYFAAFTAARGHELWSTDGTAAGTRLEVDINPGPASSRLNGLTVAGDRMYFSATDGTHGSEPWSTDGTVAGTRMIYDIILGPESSYPAYFTALGERVVYRAFTTPTATKPFVSGPGVPAGIRQLDPLAFDVDLQVGGFVVAAGRVVFPAGDVTSGVELWASRGEPGDARLVADITPGPVGGSPSHLTTVGDRVFFAASEPNSGEELWSSDGTWAGTGLVRDIKRGVGSSDLNELRRLGDQLVFFANDGVHGRELWRTAGTAASTHLVVDGYPGPESGGPGAFGAGTPVAGRLLYRGVDSRGAEPWATDGRTARRLADLAPGVADSQPQHVGVAGNAVLFDASDGRTRRLYAWAAVGSRTTVRAKRSYSATQARRKRIRVPVSVRTAAGTRADGGRVVLTLKGRTIGSARLVDGVARVRITVRLKPGRTHRIVAVWSGVPIVAAGSASRPVKVKVKAER